MKTSTYLKRADKDWIKNQKFLYDTYIGFDCKCSDCTAQIKRLKKLLNK